MPVIIGILLILVVIIFTCECVDNYVIPPINESVSYAHDNYLVIIGIAIGLVGLFFLRVFLLSDKSKPVKEKKIYSEPVKNETLFVKIKDYADEEEIMEEPELGNLEKHINEEIENISDLKPVKNLDFEGFAKHASSLMDNPAKYSDFITGWFFRGQVKRTSKAIEEISKLMNDMRLASINARDLQTEILKSKYLLKYQAMIAIWEAKTEYSEKVDAAEVRKIAREAEKNRLRFLSEFYKNANPKELTSSEQMLHLLQTPIATSKSEASLAGASIEAKVYANPLDALKIEQENGLMKLALEEKMAELKEKAERVNLIKQEVRSKKSQADLDENTARLEIGENLDSKRRSSDSEI